MSHYNTPRWSNPVFSLPHACPERLTPVVTDQGRLETCRWLAKLAWMSREARSATPGTWVDRLRPTRGDRRH